MIESLYTALARFPAGAFGWPIGKQNALTLGYDGRWLDTLPESVWESSAAVGHPFDVVALQPGESVLDLGCGAGADLCIAGLLVGEGGRAVGIDLTPAMVEKAKKNAAHLELEHVTATVGDIAALPIADESIDVVLSNGVINLSEHKPCVFREAFRVLRAGGRLCFADMVREKDASPTCDGSWAGCVAGTVEPENYLAMLAAVGFRDAALISFTPYKTDPSTIGALFSARKPA